MLCLYDEYGILIIMLLNVIMLNVAMLSVIMLSRAAKFADIVVNYYKKWKCLPGKNTLAYYKH